jgi:hypothetical protein
MSKPSLQQNRRQTRRGARSPGAIPSLRLDDVVLTAGDSKVAGADVANLLETVDLEKLGQIADPGSILCDVYDVKALIHCLCEWLHPDPETGDIGGALCAAEKILDRVARRLSFLDVYVDGAWTVRRATTGGSEKRAAMTAAAAND